jgi:hypothetical protein
MVQPLLTQVGHRGAGPAALPADEVHRNQDDRGRDRRADREGDD